MAARAASHARKALQHAAGPLSYPQTALGIPAGIRACLFDLDGVLTRTVEIHAVAWKSMFDTYLADRARRTGELFVAFDPVTDYGEYVDGRSREDGVRSFLASRGMTLPEGGRDDPPDTQTVFALARRKHEVVLRLIAENGVEAYPGSVRYVRASRAAGLKTAVVSASADCRAVLEAAGIADLFDVRIDGLVAAERHLRGKPAADTFLEGARAVGVPPREAVVVEDALAGVAAGRAGHFACVIGVDRVGHRQALLAHGADIVVADLAELLDTP